PDRAAQVLARVAVEHRQHLVELHRRGRLRERHGPVRGHPRRRGRARLELHVEAALEEQARADPQRRVAVQRQGAPPELHHPGARVAGSRFDAGDLPHVHARQPHRRVRVELVRARHHGAQLEGLRERQRRVEREVGGQHDPRDHAERGEVVAPALLLGRLAPPRHRLPAVDATCLDCRPRGFPSACPALYGSFPASHSRESSLGYTFACSSGLGLPSCSIWSTCSTGIIRSQFPPSSPSLDSDAMLRTQILKALQESWASAAVCRIAPRPTKAEPPNVARSLVPSALSALREAALWPKRSTASSAFESAGAMAPPSRAAGTAATAAWSSACAVAGRSLAAGRSPVAIAAASSSAGRAAMSEAVSASSVGGASASPLERESPARSIPATVVLSRPSRSAAGRATGSTAEVAAARPCTKPPRLLSG